MTSEIKAIIAPLLPGLEEFELSWAGRLARDFGASVDAAYIRQEERLAVSLLEPTSAGYASSCVITELLEAERNGEADAQWAFQKKKDRATESLFGRFVMLGDRPQARIEHVACCYDLAVTVLPGEPLSPPAMGLLLKLVLGAGVPVFAAPRAAPAERPLEKAVVAWDASCEAGRAMRAAVPLLKRAREVVIVHLGPISAGHDPVRASIDYLKAHKITASLVHAPAADFGQGAALLALIERVCADVVVMGAYGHPRWMEEAFGGATHDVVRLCPVPVLLAH